MLLYQFFFRNRRGEGFSYSASLAWTVKAAERRERERESDGQTLDIPTAHDNE
jgi:hypothetical protein